MKKLISLCAVLFLSLTLASCKKSKTMNPKDFLKIQNKILESDLTPKAKEAIAKKFGYTLEQYESYAKKVESDPALKAKVGEQRLKMLQGESKK